MQDKILTLDDAVAKRAQWQAAGEKVVFTNGCFDILHLGHVDYMEKAKALGHRLIVGMNTDASVRRLKGADRPVCDQTSRSRVMAALGCVDAVVLFDEATPEALIHAIKPDILTKGDDYSIANIVGADFVLANGGEVKTIPFVEGYSTSAIIRKIKNTHTLNP
jgi:rfaE bifunctional protein nucleotidyltransferase chain/domain